MKDGKARIHWLDSRTGLRGVYEDREGFYSMHEDPEEEGGWGLFWWTEGNAGCDCNREIFFLGTPSEDTKCGDGRFVIEKFEVQERGTEEWVTLPYVEKERK